MIELTPEPVRLVVWDLDDTFWSGTLNEGGITWRPEHAEIVRALARRGIISSICSKNDFIKARDVLRQHGLWESFVFPSMNWQAKGPRLAALAEAVQLRPASILLIDDNPRNRAEAEHYVPGIQTADITIIPGLLENPLFAGKDDSALTRLAQYRLLERRAAARQAAGDDTTEFLRASQIRVTIEHDLEPHLDRVIELINRTNQLNYTKRRLPDDMEAARQALRAELADYRAQAGILRVQDNYGDYGWCGFYLIKSGAAVHRLWYFCFSCRILGMGVETWLYNHLGRPRLTLMPQEAPANPAPPAEDASQSATLPEQTEAADSDRQEILAGAAADQAATAPSADSVKDARAVPRLRRLVVSARKLARRAKIWLLKRVGRWRKQVYDRGPDPRTDTRVIDWITLVQPGAEDAEHAGAVPSIGYLYARGGCDLYAVTHYFTGAAREVITDFSIGRGGANMRLDHSIIARHALRGVPRDAMAAFAALGYGEADFAPPLLRLPKSEHAAWLLSFWADADFALYRHTASGQEIPVSIPGVQTNTRDVTALDPATAPNPEAARILRVLREDFSYEGMIKRGPFVENLTMILATADPSVRIFILMPAETRGEGPDRVVSANKRRLNSWTRDAVADHPNVELIAIGDFVQDASEMLTGNHFSRMVYYRVFRHIMARLSPHSAATREHVA